LAAFGATELVSSYVDKIKQLMPHVKIPFWDVFYLRERAAIHRVNTIRNEKPEDITGIRDILVLASPTPDEANLVDALGKRNAVTRQGDRFETDSCGVWRLNGMTRKMVLAE
jgi:hypothetical protein